MIYRVHFSGYVDVSSESKPYAETEALRSIYFGKHVEDSDLAIDSIQEKVS